MTVKVVALAEHKKEYEVISDKNLKLSIGKKNEKLYKFDGAACIKSDVKEAFNKLIKPILINEAKSDKCFFSLSSGNETFLANLDGDVGVINLMAEQIFETIDDSMNYLISCSMTTIGIDGSLNDVLNPHNRKMSIKQHSKMGLVIENSSRLVAPTSFDLSHLFLDGLKVVAALQMNNLGCLFDVSVKMIQKNSVESKIFETTTKFLHLNLTNESAMSLENLLHQIKQKKSILHHTTLSLILDDIFSNYLVIMIPEIRGKDRSIEDAILNISEAVKGFKSKKLSKKAANNLLDISELRNEIEEVREKIVSQKSPRIDDIEKMEHLIKDLEECKMGSWDQIILSSLQYYHERKINLQDKGLSWILDSAVVVNPGAVKDQQKKLAELSKMFKEQRSGCERINLELKAEIENYSQIVSAGKSVPTKLTSQVQLLKEKAKNENDRLVDIRGKMQKCRQDMKLKVEEGLNDVATGFNIVLAALVDERSQVREENRQIIEEEMNRMKLNVEHETNELKFKSPNLEVANDKIELLKLQSEKQLLTTKLKIMQLECEKYDEDFTTIVERHSKDVEIQRLQNLQVFRLYRKTCDEYKFEVENRWRTLLDDAIKDAVFLSARNEELKQKNIQLSQENSSLRDQLSTKTSK